MKIIERESKRRACGFFYIGSDKDSNNRLSNGAILIINKILKHVMPSAAEADIGSVFLNAKEATFIPTILEEMGHPQPPTLLHTDNTTSPGYKNDTGSYLITVTSQLKSLNTNAYFPTTLASAWESRSDLLTHSTRPEDPRPIVKAEIFKTHPCFFPFLLW
jgi:hypothetical protein